MLLHKRKVVVEEAPPGLDAWGRGLVAKYLTQEVPPGCHPLGPDNKLVFATGPWASTGMSSAQRLSVGAKSPLTGGIREANAGGTFARALARLGFRAIVIEGISSERLYLLYVGKQVELLPAEELAGLGTHKTVMLLQEKFGRHISVCCIGPAGEWGLPAAAVAVTDGEGYPGRFAGRGGLGAVMGKKGIKAIVVDKSPGRSTLADPTGFKEAVRTWHQRLQENPLTAKIYPEYGTASMLDAVRALGALPTFNFRLGSFEKVGALLPETLRDVIEERGGEGQKSHACIPGCLIRCSNIFPDKNGKRLVSPLEYETLVMFGSNLGIGSLDAIASYNWHCNDLGVDTIEIGGAIGVAMEAGLLPFGDEVGVTRLLDEIRKGSVLGRLIASGVEITGRALGVYRIPAMRGQGLPAYDPRGIKGLGVTFATSPMGPDHTAGHTVRSAVNHHRPEGQVDASRQAQLFQTVLDVFGLCSFSRSAVKDDYELLGRLLFTATGSVSPTGKELVEMAGRVLRCERDFNVRAGLKEVTEVPEFMRKEKLPPHDLVFDVTYEEMLNIF